MNITQHPELLDRLAASYALGTLRGGARRRFETLAREQAPVRAAALIWQARIGSVAELQTPAQPTAAVWTRIDNLVQADVQRQAMRDAHAAPPATGGWLRNLLLWRGAAAAGVAAAIVAMVVGVDQRAQLGTQIASLQTQLLATPQIKYVAVLADGKADPSMLVTFDARTNKLLLQRGNLRARGGTQAAVDLHTHHHGRQRGHGTRSGGAAPHQQVAPPATGGRSSRGHTRSLHGRRSLVGLHEVVDAGPDGRGGVDGRLQLGQARPAGLPHQGGGAHGGVFTGQGFKTAAGAPAQRAQGVAGGQAVEQVGVLGDVHGDDLMQNAPCRCATAPAPGESRS